MIAASIQYDFIPPPAGLSADFQPREGISLRYLAIEAIDGFQIDAALWQPDRKPPSDTTLVVTVHGSGGSYQRAPQSALGARLASKGYATLAINTRQHDAAINTDNFFDVRRDIDAAVQTGRALGYRILVLQGHSLGNIQVQFYAATNWDRDIKAVMLLGASATCRGRRAPFWCKTKTASGVLLRPRWGRCATALSTKYSESRCPILLVKTSPSPASIS